MRQKGISLHAACIYFFEGAPVAVDNLVASLLHSISLMFFCFFMACKDL